MTKTKHSHSLDPGQYRAVVDGMIAKIRRAGVVERRAGGTGEARLLFAIFELAVRDWLGISSMSGEPVSRVDQHHAGLWLKGRTCKAYLELVGIDPEFALEKVLKLKAVRA